MKFTPGSVLFFRSLRGATELARETNVGWHSKDNLKDLRAIIRTEWQQGHLVKGW